MQEVSNLPPPKRPRVDVGNEQGHGSIETNGDANKMSVALQLLISSKNWEEVAQQVKAHPERVSNYSKDPSMLALACRSGAPYDCIQAIVNAAPHKLRRLLDARGTPLHEAIVCEDIGPQAVEYLLKVDEKLGSETPCAAMMQDVDGYTPLHLLIRRRFQSVVLMADNNNNNINNSGEDGNNSSSSNNNNNFMAILALLVESCAEAIVIPDRGEYEEPPVVMALKANVYAPMLQQSEEAEPTAARIERLIYEMVQCMLQRYPGAASCIFNGYRGQYTALHSAVFHGRSPETIQLLLQAEQEAPSTTRRACLLGNTQGELPLHFCAMRGEPPRTVALLAKAAPEAISKRDASGLTPVHWLWIRYVSTLLAIDDGRGNPLTIPLRATCESHASVWEQNNFEANLHLLRRVDPSVDFLRMRHIPVEVQEERLALPWAERTISILKGIKERIQSAQQSEVQTNGTVITLSRLEAIAALFWTKLVALLKASIDQGDEAQNHQNEGLSLIQAAFMNEFCPPLVARIVAQVFSEQLSLPDSRGRLALHFAAMRPWHPWEWPRGDGTSDAASSKLLSLEYYVLLKNVMALTSTESAKQKDERGCLPLHYLISSCIQACCSSGQSRSKEPIAKMIDILGSFVKMNPASLNTPNPQSGLFPFMQASSQASEALISTNTTSSFAEEFPLSIVFTLLREDPSLIEQGQSK